MKVFNQKKYMLLIGSFVILEVIFTILDDYYGLLRTAWIGDLYYIVGGALIWIFLFLLRKENFKTVGKVIINLIFVAVTIAFPLAFVLDLVTR